MNSKPFIVIIAGPTASGKTALAIKLAKLLNGEVISADSMQIYRYMNIGTAKPTVEEMENVPHHLIDIINPDEEFSVALFKKYADEKIREITTKDKLPIIVGGTGLYINSLTYHLNFSDSAEDKEYREYLSNLAENHGNEYVYNMLKKVDPDAANKIHPNNLKRVIRALEVFKNTGTKISEYQKETQMHESDYNFYYIALDMPRDILYDRINKRVDTMVSKGLVEEVIKLKEMGYHRNLQSMQAIGYKEIFDYIEGDLSLQDSIELIKRNSRRYAKRQLTWFRKDSRINWINVFNQNIDTICSNIINDIEGFLKRL